MFIACPFLVADRILTGHGEQALEGRRRPADGRMQRAATGQPLSAGG
jgi:hypothetical protein